METRLLSPLETREEEHFKVMVELLFSCLGKVVEFYIRAAAGSLNSNARSHTDTQTPKIYKLIIP